MLSWSLVNAPFILCMKAPAAKRENKIWIQRTLHMTSVEIHIDRSHTMTPVTHLWLIHCANIRHFFTSLFQDFQKFISRFVWCRTHFLGVQISHNISSCGRKQKILNKPYFEVWSLKQRSLCNSPPALVRTRMAAPLHPSQVISIENSCLCRVQ